MQLDTESLRTFLMVIETGQITAAAQRLNLTQSAVSRKILRLEDRVGKPLLDRAGHNIVPTSAGRDLLDDATAIVALHDRAVARLADSEISGRVRVGATEEVRPAEITSIFGEFNRDHPAAFVELVVTSTDNLVARLDSGDLDIILFQATDEMRRASDRVLWPDRLAWFSSRFFAFDEGAVPLVTYGRDCFYSPLSEPHLDEAGIDYWTSMSLTSTAAVVGAIEAGLGVGVLASKVAGPELVEWSRATELPELPEIYQVLRYRSRGASDAVRELADTLVAGFTESLMVA